MTTEFDLECATCGGPLHEAEATPESLDVDVRDSLSVAECRDCGGRYFPERTLDAIGRP